MSARLSAEAWRHIESLIRQDWSPQQVSGWLRREQRLRVSHEWVYQYIYAEQTAGGTLWELIHSGN